MVGRSIFLAISLLASLEAKALGDDIPKSFVSLADIAPNIKIDMQYFGGNNFVGRPLPGYRANKCYLTKNAAEALRNAQTYLDAFGLRLVVYDCYRPQRTVDAFVAWAKNLDDLSMQAQHYPNVKKNRLFTDGYIAEKSGHSRGGTVDLAIEGLDFGTPFDFFDPKSHTLNAEISVSARAHRALLKALLEKAGFVNYPSEWWHFTIAPELFPETYFDFEIR